MTLAKLGDKFPRKQPKNIVFIEPALELVNAQKPEKSGHKSSEPVNNNRSNQQKETEKAMQTNSIQNEQSAVNAISTAANGIDLMVAARKADNRQAARDAGIVGSTMVVGGIAGGALVYGTVPGASALQIAEGAATGVVCGGAVGVATVGVLRVLDAREKTESKK